MSSASVIIAISLWLANRARFAGLLSVHTAQHPHFFSFFLNYPLILGADAARNFSKKNRTT